MGGGGLLDEQGLGVGGRTLGVVPLGSEIFLKSPLVDREPSEGLCWGILGTFLRGTALEVPPGTHGSHKKDPKFIETAVEFV